MEPSLASLMSIKLDRGDCAPATAQRMASSALLAALVVPTFGLPEKSPNEHYERLADYLGFHEMPTRARLLARMSRLPVRCLLIFIFANAFFFYG